MLPPLINATLTKVETAVSSADYDQAEGAESEVWAGSVGAYITEKVVDELAAEREDEIKLTRMVVPLDVGLLIKRGHTLTYDYAGQTDLTRKAKDVQRYQLFGTARVWMDES